MPASTSARGDINWRISQRCDGGACVKIAQQDDSILIGDGSQLGSPYITCTAAEWTEFLLGVKSSNSSRVE